MKQFIRNLFIPFSVLAMLSVGAFTMNASNKEAIVTVVEMSEQTPTPYPGLLYYLDGNVFRQASQLIKKECSFDGTGPVYIDDVNSVHQQIYGWDASVAEYKPLRLIM